MDIVSNNLLRCKSGTEPSLNKCHRQNIVLLLWIPDMPNTRTCHTAVYSARSFFVTLSELVFFLRRILKSYNHIKLLFTEPFSCFLWHDMTDKRFLTSGSLMILYCALLQNSRPFSVVLVFCQIYSVCKLLYRIYKMNLRYLVCHFKTKFMYGHQMHFCLWPRNILNLLFSNHGEVRSRRSDLFGLKWIS